MKVVQETTDWGNVNSPNHVYFLNDSRDKMFAYLPQGSGKIKQFKQPISFYTRGRKFQEVPNTWAFAPGQAEGSSWTVAGSKGAEYTVTESTGHLKCSCPGFQFRGECKHTKATV